VSQLAQAIREATASSAPPAAAAAPAPKYNLAIPPQVLQAMRSEDQNEFGGAMHAVINGVANMLHRDTVTMLSEQVMPAIQQAVQMHISSLQQQHQVASDFYGKYQQLGHPQLRGIVQQASLAVAQKRVHSGRPLEWGEEMRDEIAEAVFSVIPALRGPAAPGAPTTQPAARQNGRQPFATGTTARPAGTGAKSPADELADFVKG